MTLTKRVCGLVTIGAICLAVTGAGSAAQPKDDKKPGAAQPTPPAKPGDKEKPGAQPPGGMTPEQQKRMEGSMKPGPQHAAMAKGAGEFTTATKFRMSPAMPWAESAGTCKKTVIMDGRYLQEEASGSMEMPGPDGTMQKTMFKGMGVFGYNNTSKHYEGSWVDKLGTGVMHMTGTSADGGKTVEWSSSYDDPMSGKKKTARMVGKHADDDHFTLEFFEKADDGREFKSMEIAYTRKGAPEKPKPPAAPPAAK